MTQQLRSYGYTQENGKYIDTEVCAMTFTWQHDS